MSTSTSPDPARLRLAQYMDDRRADLRLTWAEVAEAAGINRETLRQIRSGTSEIRTLTQRAVEDGLRWKPGSIRAILAGGEPTPIDSGQPERQSSNAAALQRRMAEDPEYAQWVADLVDTVRRGQPPEPPSAERKNTA